MRQMKKRALAIIACLAMVVSMLPRMGVVQAADAEYQIYPTPRSMQYKDGSYTLKDINVIYDEAIDEATEERLQEAAALLNLKVTAADKADSTKTNVYVGVYGEDDKASAYIEENYTVDSSLFGKTDAYFLASNDGEIVVLGKDTDASYYGLTTLYHVFTQVGNKTVRNFEVKDYADVVSRGFIEGYYGNPWSTEDRVNLMKWGGYYKLNSYFYAPKDDPKHNAKWKELYSSEEIETKIKPLAEAGNNSKCRFVYALHPYMYNAIRYSSEEAYQEDLAIMQAKFEQVIKAGVRQIAILADDAGNVGGSNYVKTLVDMTAWIKEMQKTYPDLKLTLPFCTQEYMGNGQSYYSQFPENVQIVMTGGRVWGEVSNNFTTTFTNNVGRGPYLWINWPCTDNSKKHLIMGGYDTFLQPGVDPSKIQGIVLNPMQQSEPSKVAIFGNACYSWNIWESKAESDAAWNASFSYVDHNSAIPNDASNALREMSKHMINQNMDSRVTALQESVELAPKLNAFKTKFEAGTLTVEDIDAMIAEFKVLQDASKTFRAQAGDENLKNQIVYWLNCWDDTTEAVISYLNAEKSLLNGADDAIVWDYYAKGQAAFEASKTYGFHYVDHTEFAEVGVQHIVPFMEKLDEVLSAKVAVIVDPTQKPVDKVTGTPIYNEENMGIEHGELDMYTDGKTDDYIGFGYVDGGDYTAKDAWVGMQFGKVQAIDSVKITQGSGDHIDKGTLQYLNTSDEWVTIESQTGIGQVFEAEFDEVSAKAIRLVNDEQKGIWWRIYEFELNVQKATTGGAITLTPFDAGTGVYSGTKANVVDGDPATALWYNTVGAAGQFVGVDLGRNVNIGRVYFLMDSGDHWTNYELQYSTNGSNYNTYKAFTGNVVDEDLSAANIEARYIRFYSTGATGTWTKFYEIQVSERVESEAYTNSAALKGIATDVRTSTATLAPTEGITLAADEYIGIDLRRIKDLATVSVTADDKLTLQVSKNEVDWTEVEAGEVTEDARFVRLINKTDAAITFDLTQFVVTSHEVSAPSLHSTTMGINGSWGVAEDCRENGAAFDGNVDTITEFGDLPQKDQYIIYDLGQDREISKLEIFCQDSAVNYIRDAEILVSADMNDWTKVITIGDGVQNMDDAGVKCIDSDAGYSQTTSEYPNKVSIEGTIETTTARYIKIVMTATNNNRAVVFNEIAINDGEYVSVVNDPTFEATAIEVQGFVPQNMVDGDLSTAYKPNTTEAGSIKYTLSENLNVNRFNIVQKGVASDAKVSLFVEQDGERKWVDAGTLDKSLNKIYCNYDLILEMKIEWEAGKVPTISEIIRFSEEDVTRKGLQAYVDGLDVNAEDYTEESYAEFAKALAAAEALLADETSSDKDLQEAWDELKIAYAALAPAEVKGDMSALKALADSYVEDNYTTTSWKTFEKVLDKVYAAIKVDDSTDAEIEALRAELLAAADKLVRKADTSELTELLEVLAAYDADKYTEESYKVLADAVNKAEKALEDADITQKEVDALVAEIMAAIDGLESAENPEEPEDPEKPVDPEKPEDSDKEDTDKEENKSPATGDSTMIMLWAVMMIMAATVVVMRRKER